MKKAKQILALLGCIILFALYVSTLVFALIGSQDALILFRVSIYATIVVPVLIWAYTLIYKLLKKYYSHRDDNTDLSDKD